MMLICSNMFKAIRNEWAFLMFFENKKSNHALFGVHINELGHCKTGAGHFASLYGISYDYMASDFIQLFHKICHIEKCAKSRIVFQIICSYQLEHLNNIRRLFYFAGI